MKFFALVAAASATQFSSMNEDELLAQLSSTLSSAQRSEARGDGDAAVAKTAAIKNIQKSLTARILKRLDDGQPHVEDARKMKAIEGMQPQINEVDDSSGERSFRKGQETRKSRRRKESKLKTVICLLDGGIDSCYIEI